MKKLFSLLLVTLMLLSPFAMCVNAESVTEQAVQVKDTNEQKITSDLQAHLDTVDDDEYVPVYVWLNDYGEDMLYEVLSQRLGKTVTSDTEEAYIQDKIEVKEKLLSKGLENLAKTNEYKLQSMSQGVMDIRNLTGNTFKAQANLSGIMTDEEIDTCIESNMTSSEIIELSERNQFLSDYRQSRKTVNTAVNTTFYNALDLDKCRNVYLDPLLCRVTMECKKSYVDDMEGLSIVSQVGIYEEVEFVEEAESAANDPADTSEGQPLLAQNTVDGVTYTGAGIKVGVLEVGDIDTGATHLRGRTPPGITSYYVTPADTSTSHATAVVSILAGKPITYSGTTYQGVAPGVTIFFAGGADAWCSIPENGTDEEIEDAQNLNTIIERMDWLLLEQNCDVINMSMGNKEGNDGGYLDYDRYIDNIITEHRVVIVIAAGNSGGNIVRPAMSYNSIVVGNANGLSCESGRYTMKDTSSYEEDGDLTNKPDISAFGTQIMMLNNNSIPSSCFTTLNNPKERNYITGTSFATPQVSGTVALMMQANPYLIGRPNTVKAILLNSADENIISIEVLNGVNNGIITEEPIMYDTSKIPSATGILREKSGAGLLNIEAAIRMSNSNLYYDFTMGQASTSVMPDTDTTMTTETYYFNAGTTIEFGLVYEKATDELLTDFNFNDLDIRIFDSNDNFVFASSDYINNVEMFKCTFAASGEYKFDIFCYNAESPINATFILSCSCKEKMLTHSNYQLTQHTVSCDAIDGCGFSCYEKHRSISVSKDFGYGTSATFKVYYLFEKGNRQTPMFDYFEISVENGVSTQGRLCFINPDGMTTSTNPTGETRTYTYSATIELPDGNPVFPTASFVVRIDYFDKTISIE